MSLKVRLAVKASIQVLAPVAFLGAAWSSGCAGAKQAPATNADSEITPARQEATPGSPTPVSESPPDGPAETAASSNSAAAAAEPVSTAVPKPSAGSSNSITHAGSTETRTTEVPAAATEPAKRPGLTVAETRTTQVIQSVVAQNRLSVRACYEKALMADPKLRGTLTVHFTIDSDGAVTSADVNAQRTTLSEPGVQQCALAAVKNIKFPKSSRGFESTVNYPFDFRPRY